MFDTSKKTVVVRGHAVYKQTVLLLALLFLNNVVSAVSSYSTLFFFCVFDVYANLKEQFAPKIKIQSLSTGGVTISILS